MLSALWVNLQLLQFVAITHPLRWFAQLQTGGREPWQRQASRN
jgi:hypothetical protein